MWNLDIGRMPPFFWEQKQAQVPTAGSAYIYGSTVPADENWLLITVSVYVPNNAPCHAVLQMDAVANGSLGRVDLAMTKNLANGSDPDLVNALLGRNVLIPGGGRLAAFVKNGSGQAAGLGILVAHYLRFPRGAMPQGM
jgi:hypothetical protein